MVTKKMVGVLAVAAAAVALGQEAYGTVAAAEVTAVVRGAGCTHKSTSYTCPKPSIWQWHDCATGSVNWANPTTKETDKNVTAPPTAELCKVGEYPNRCESYIKSPAKAGCDTPNTSN